VHEALQDHGKWMFLERGWDETPLHVDFGHLSEDIAPFARFFVSGNAAAYLGKTLASWSDTLSLGLPRASHGVVEICVQTLTVQFGPGHGYSLPLPLRVMSGKTSNHVFEALQTLAGGKWDIEALLASPCELLLLIDLADSASSNRKCTAFVAEQLRGSKVLYWPQRCMIHQTFRGAVRVLKRFNVLKKLCCLSNVLHVSNRQLSLKRAIVEVVRAKLNYQVGLLQPPPEHAVHRVHQRLLTDRLVWRRKVKEDRAGNPFTDLRDHLLQAKVELLHAVLHGNWAEEEITHWCPGRGCACGGSRQACATTVCELLVWLILTSMPDTPSFSRWTTLGPSSAWLGATGCLGGFVA
jgi:hypothetical protein